MTYSDGSYRARHASDETADTPLGYVGQHTPAWIAAHAIPDPLTDPIAEWLDPPVWGDP